MHMCVRSSACVCVQTCARMRRMHPSVRARVRATPGGRRKGATFHLGITVHMHIIICTRACMYTCMRALVECISACVGVGVDTGACVGVGVDAGVCARARGWSRCPLIVCHSVHFT